MHKTTFITTLGLALVLGAGAAVSAQPPVGGRPDAAAADTTHRGRRGPGGPGGERRGARGPEGLLLRDITLTDAQKQQVATLRQQQRERMRAERGQVGAGRDANRDGANGAQRQRPDSATIAARRKQFAEQRQRDEAALRAILTPAQQKQFDANRAEMEKRMRDRQAQAGDRAPRGERRGRQA